MFKNPIKEPVNKSFPNFTPPSWSIPAPAVPSLRNPGAEATSWRSLWGSVSYRYAICIAPFQGSVGHLKRLEWSIPLSCHAHLHV